MYRTLLFALLLGSVSSVTNASPILQTAVFDPTACCGGASVRRDEFLGARFDLTETTLITAIGGQFTSGTGSIFGAIVPVDLSTGIPLGSGPNDLEMYSLAATLLSPPRLTNGDVWANLDVVLQPGAYALVFGSGLFGATGDAAMAVTSSLGATLFSSELFALNIWSHPEAIYFAPGTHIERFLIDGETVPKPVPEPSTLTLMFLGSAACARSYKRLKRRQK